MANRKLISSLQKKKKHTLNVKYLLLGLAFLLVGLQGTFVLLAKDIHSESTATKGADSELLGQPVQFSKRQNSLQSAADSNKNPSEHLPEWIRKYLAWHQSVRASFPGQLLFTDPNAPKLLIRTCLGLCGGLNDRLGQLPWDLYLANQTGRVLLLHWHRPVPLENFLVPNELDWSVPKEIKGFFSKTDVRVSREEMRVVRAYKELFEGFKSEQPEEDFWNSHLDLALTRATTGEFKDIKVLRHRILGHLNEDKLEERLAVLGETDMLHWTPSFGNIFRMMFRPSEAVAAQLKGVYQQLNIEPGKYSAVHCRVRHPKATPSDVYIKGKNADYPADKTGLPWEGGTRLFAIDTATHAVKCARTLLQSNDEPVYFFSDSNDLVNYMAHDLSNDEFVSKNATFFERSETDAAALQVAQTTRVIARDVTEENAHIDRQKGRDPPAYFGTFVDMFLAIHARCVTYGIGYYAVFATKISGTSCKLLYQEESWGGTDNKRANTKVCELT